MKELAPSIDCGTCKSEGTMKPTKVPKFSFMPRLIGYIIVIPSLLGMLFAVLMMFSTGQATTEVMEISQTDAEKAGVALGATIGVGISLLVGISSLVGGLIGWLLIMKRKVYKCVQCGFILERA